METRPDRAPTSRLHLAPSSDAPLSPSASPRSPNRSHSPARRWRDSQDNMGSYGCNAERRCARRHARWARLCAHGPPDSQATPSSYALMALLLARSRDRPPSTRIHASDHATPRDDDAPATLRRGGVHAAVVCGGLTPYTTPLGNPHSCSARYARATLPTRIPGTPRSTVHGARSRSTHTHNAAAARIGGVTRAQHDSTGCRPTNKLRRSATPS